MICKFRWSDLFLTYRRGFWLQGRQSGGVNAQSWLGDLVPDNDVRKRGQDLRGLRRRRGLDERLTRMPWLQSVSQRAPEWQSALSDMWSAIPRVGLRRLDTDAVAGVEALIPRWTAVSQYLAGPPFTLLHGDYIISNCALDDEDDPLIVLDWQFVTYGNPAIDLISVLHARVGAGVEPVTERLQRAHHTSLVAAGVEDYTYEQLDEDRQVAYAYVVYGFVFGAYFGMLRSPDWLESEAPGEFEAMGDHLRQLGFVERLERDFPV